MPVIVLAVLVVYGLILRRLAFGQPSIPLEIIFILAASYTITQLLLTGHRWLAIQDSIFAKFQKVIPAFMILFCIGLSRSLEDTGTMLESIVPWHTSAVYMVATLGVGFEEYWHWQLLSLANFVVAIFLAMTGIGCYYGSKTESSGNGSTGDDYQGRQ